MRIKKRRRVWMKVKRMRMKTSRRENGRVKRIV